MIKIVKVRLEGSPKGYRLKVFNFRVAKLSTLWRVAFIVNAGLAFQLACWCFVWTALAFDGTILNAVVGQLNAMAAAYFAYKSYQSRARFKINHFLEL
jgi:hypothetical protein